jgi:hypothetical protein
MYLFTVHDSAPYVLTDSVSSVREMLHNGEKQLPAGQLISRGGDSNIVIWPYKVMWGAAFRGRIMISVTASWCSMVKHTTSYSDTLPCGVAHGKRTSKVDITSLNSLRLCSMLYAYWLWSASKLYRPSDRRLLVPTFCG